jgi:phosphoribosyl-ATP pyrophosphohydrolase/phosphoribosyl-AMP cyclohydrolase
VIVPSIDIMDGQAVQLVGGRDKALEAGDPMKVAERFAVAGELAVIDLDAALGRGSNSSIIERLSVPGWRRHPDAGGGP